MIRAWTMTGKCRPYVLDYLFKNAGVTTTKDLLDRVDARLPSKLFDSKLEFAVREVAEAYWPRILAKFKFGPEYEEEVLGWFTSIRVSSLEKFKDETIELVKAGLWKLKIDSLSSDDESIIQARLITLKEAARLASKFKEVYVCEYKVGHRLRDRRVPFIVPFDTKGEQFQRLLLGEDQVWSIKESGNSSHTWYLIFGDGGIPEVLDYKLEIKADSGNIYIFPLDDISALIGQDQDLEKIKALVGK